MLDLPCGYGRVLRWLRPAIPEAHIVACDTSSAAVGFCARTFGVTGVVAQPLPDSPIAGTATFDVVWCGSLLTHVSEPHWHPLLAFFARQLAPGGIVVFTTHGEQSESLLRRGLTTYGLPPDRVGALLAGLQCAAFAYADYPSLVNYGISVARPVWVETAVSAQPDLRLVKFSPTAWDQHQDVVVCARC